MGKKIEKPLELSGQLTHRFSKTLNRPVGHLLAG